MSTRSAILQQQPDGTFRGIYCHFDGYPSGVGEILLLHYQDAEKATRLIDLGDISCLGERVEPIGAHSFDNREKGTTSAYMRDRGETGCEPKIGATVNDVTKNIGHNGHVYVFADGAWTHNGSSLADAVAQDS